MESGDISDRFPTEAELVSAYGVSRHTVRQALAQLRSEGRVVAERGRMPRVNPVHDQPVGGLWSLFRAIEAGGQDQTSQVLALHVRADDVAADRLGLEPDAELVYLERVRLVDGVPLAWDRAWMPASVARPLLDADFTHTALYDELASRCGVSLTGGQESVAAAVPDEELRRRLQMRAGVAVLTFDRVASSRDQVVEWRWTAVRADRFRLQMGWAPDTARRVELSGHLESPGG